MIILAIVIANVIALTLAFEPVIKNLKGIWVLEYTSGKKHHRRKKIKICI